MIHISRRALRRLTIVLVFLLVASGCGGDDDGEGADPDPDTSSTTTTEGGGDEGEDEGDGGGDEPQYGGNIVVALEGETSNWVPGTGQFASSGVTVSMAIYDPLMVQTAEGDLEPNLAESLEPNEDLTEWTMTLRPDVQFHDGSVFDAETLKWNFDTLHNVGTSNTYGTIQGAGIVEVEVVDDLTVIYRLSGPNAGFPDVLRGALGWPTSRQAYESLGADALGEAPVGTGPFVFEEWRRDEHFKVTRNENYWRTDADGNPLPYLDGVEYRPIPDEDSRVQSLDADTVQVVSTLRGSTIKAIQALGDGYGGNLHVGNVAGASIMNVLVPPVDDVRIRQALAYASDPEAVAIVLGDDGLVPVTTQFFSKDSPWYSEVAAEAYPSAEGPQQEPAIDLVEEYRADPNRSDGRAPGDPIEITYSCPPDPSLVEIGQLLQQLWGDIGVEVNLESVEQPQLIANAVGGAEQTPPWSGDYMVNCWRAGVESDPLTTFQNYFGPVETTPGNFTNFTHPDIDAAIDTLRTESDFAARYEATERINVVVNENSPIIWGVGTASYVGWRDDIHGIATWRLPEGSMGSGTYDGRVILHQAWMDQE